MPGVPERHSARNEAPQQLQGARCRPDGQHAHLAERAKGEQLKIIQLTAENVKKLKVVDITPKGPLVQVTSRKNGQGKTSVLDSIWWALGGEKNVQGVPIRKGAESGRIRLNLGDLIVERRFLASGSSPITVRNAAGAQPGTPDKKLPVYGSPQEILNALIGRLSFDPLAFARKKPREQHDDLKAIAHLEIDVDALNSQNAADFKRRQDINRDAKAKRAQAVGIVVPADLPERPIDESDLLNQMQDAATHNAAIETRKARRQQTQRDANDKKAEGVRLRERADLARSQASARIADLQRQIEELAKHGAESATALDEQASAALSAATELEKKINEAEALPEPIDVTALRSSLDAAKLTNAQVARRERRKSIEAEAEELETQSRELTERMEARDAQKLESLKAATMPVDGLGFGDGFVTYNGLPLDQASDGETLRVSTEIAMAENPELRVIRIRDGSLLDDDNLAIIAQMAGEKDYQVWIEQVDRSGKVGIVLEDGEVVADNQLPLVPAEVQA